MCLWFQIPLWTPSVSCSCWPLMLTESRVSDCWYSQLSSTLPPRAGGGCKGSPSSPGKKGVENDHLWVIIQLIIPPIIQQDSRIRNSKNQLTLCSSPFFFSLSLFSILLLLVFLSTFVTYKALCDAYEGIQLHHLCHAFVAFEYEINLRGTGPSTVPKIHDIVWMILQDTGWSVESWMLTIPNME